jgi:hypothetical protein
MSYIVLRDRWCNVIFLNVHVPSELPLEDMMQGYSQWQCTPRTARRTKTEPP